MHQEIMDRAEATIASLGLAYRWLEISTGDLGQSHHKQFDLEVYAPGVTWSGGRALGRAECRAGPRGTSGHPSLGSGPDCPRQRDGGSGDPGGGRGRFGARCCGCGPSRGVPEVREMT